jgi:hypothetical protein
MAFESDKNPILSINPMILKSLSDDGQMSYINGKRIKKLATEELVTSAIMVCPGIAFVFLPLIDDRLELAIAMDDSQIFIYAEIWVPVITMVSSVLGLFSFDKSNQERPNALTCRFVMCMISYMALGFLIASSSVSLWSITQCIGSASVFLQKLIIAALVLENMILIGAVINRMSPIFFICMIRFKLHNF